MVLSADGMMNCLPNLDVIIGWTGKEIERFIKSIGENVMFMRGEEYDKLRPGRYTAYTDLIKSVTGK